MCENSVQALSGLVIYPTRTRDYSKGNVNIKGEPFRRPCVPPLRKERARMGHPRSFLRM